MMFESFCNYEPILTDAFSEWTEGKGIFDVLSSLETMPWDVDETVDLQSLDFLYFGNHSGSKFCSPVVKHLLNDYGVLTDSTREMLGKMLITKYLNNWKRLWITNVVAYSPIHNYDMEETRYTLKSDSSTERQDSQENRINSTDYTYGRKEDTSITVDSGDMLYKYGINTNNNSPKPSDKSDYNETTENTLEFSGKDTNENEYDAILSSDKNSASAGEESETLHRIGNIGVTTNQKMLEDERTLWIWNFFEQIFKDLDNELALSFHDFRRT